MVSLLLVVALYTWLSYRAVRALALGSATERLESVASQLGGMLGSSMRQLADTLGARARDPAVLAYLQQPSPAAKERARAVLARVTNRPDQVMRVELWDAARKRLLTTAADTMSPGAFPSGGMSESKGGVGSLRLAHDTVSYPTIVPVPGSGSTAGYVVEWRRLLATPQAVSQLTSLIGSGAHLYVGNAAGGLWTDLVRPVPPPPRLPATGSAHTVQYVRSGETQLAAAAVIPGSVWRVLVEFPRAPVLAKAHGYLTRMSLIGALLLLLGTVAGWLVSRRITRPLLAVTRAAESMAGGNYAGRVNVTRGDEVGRLGDAFNIMAARIGESHQRLEDRVQARTRELERTLEELRDTQEQLVQRERLAILGQLAGGVGHELRNPLGVMTNAVYYLEAVTHDPTPEVKEYFGILRAQIALSEKIVNDLLDFARVKPPQRQATELAAIVDEQLARLEPAAGVRIDNHVDAGGPQVLVDRVQIGQVILNLLTNAVQAMDDEGTLTIRAAGNGVAATVTFEDTGPGIPPENLDRIFEPLFTTKVRGIGLGLAVSRSLSRANDGELTVASRVGHGTVFTLRLPRAS
jgi:signal transduction histidine kinase